jgi:glycosyltransferase involved in cell wall biosynthesis
MPKVSIIVPVYNVEKYLEKCLESLVNQTLQDIQIIVVNDGTKDNSGKIAQEYKEKYSNKILYLEKENGGLSDARNFAFPYVKGEYIGFVDSDDYIETTMYETMYEKAKKENADLVECNFAWVYENKTKLDIGNCYKDKKEAFINGRVMMCNKIFKAERIINNKFPVGLRYEDVQFFYTVLPNISKIACIDEIMYYYMQRENSIVNNQNEKTKDIFEILQNIVNYYKENNLYEEYKQELEYMYIRFLFGSSLLRMVKVKDKKLKKELLQKNWDKINEIFPNWKQNELLKTVKSKKNLYYKSINKITYKIYTKILK